MADAPKPPAPKPPAAPAGGSGFPAEAAILLFVALVLLSRLAGGSFSATGLQGLRESVFIQSLILGFKLVSAVALIFLWGGIAYVIAQNSRVEPTKISLKKKLPQFTVPGAPLPTLSGTYAAEWQSIRERLESASDKDAALLVIEADSLFDRVMQHLRIPGETMGERLKYLSTPDFKSADDVWEAHRMRNQIAHGEGQEFLYVDALYAIEKFEKGLQELGMI